MGANRTQPRPGMPSAEERVGGGPSPESEPIAFGERSTRPSRGNGGADPETSWGQRLELEGIPTLPERGRLRGRGVTIAPHRLRGARVAAGLSLAELSAGIVTRAAVHLYETGRARPSRAVLEALARRLGQPVDQFLVSVDPGEAWRDVAVEMGALARHLERLATAATEPDQGKALRTIAANLRREADAVAKVLAHRRRYR
jgi:transcriptional regulator with XRE-family HTH domain